MSSRWFRCIATVLLLTLGFGVPAQAKPSAAAASPRQGGVLEELMAYGVALFLPIKDGGPKCGDPAYCPTPPGPPPPGHTMSLMAKPAPGGKG
jgi:hypothetical protein